METVMALVAAMQARRRANRMVTEIARGENLQICAKTRGPEAKKPSSLGSNYPGNSYPGT